MTVAIPTPEEKRPKGDDGVELVYNELVARKGDTFVFLDYVFWTPRLAGAVGTRMVPVGPDEFARRVEEIKDPEVSPYAGMFEVDDMSEYEAEELAYDPSYEGKYGPAVREKCDREIEVVECVGGGRMFGESDSFDEVYRPDLLELIKDAESKAPEWPEGLK